jgi:amidase
MTPWCPRWLSRIMSTHQGERSAASGIDARDVAFAGVAGLATLLRQRKVSVHEVVELYLERIARLDPRLNAFKAVFADRAREEARAAQKRLDGGDSATLLGVPVAIKDQCDVEGEVTGYGTAAYDEPAAADSEVVRRLRAAGAIPIGKTHMCELGLWPFTEGESWGATRNPWNPDRTPGGSSGGSAAAVAAGMAAGAVGGDGGGSIRTPAGCCGVVGLKPQRDRVSLAPLADAWHGLVVVGPIARSVLDTALLLDAMAEPSGGVPGRFAAAARHEPEQLRVGVATKPPPGTRGTPDVQVLQAISDTAAALRALAHNTAEQQPDIPSGVALDFLARYLRGTHDEIRVIPHAERLERRTRSMAHLGALFPPPLMRRLAKRTSALTARINEVFDHVDVLLMPTMTSPPFEVGRWTGRGALRTLSGVAPWTPHSAVWNVTGHPAIAIPAGLSTDGLPLSVQLVGRPGDEATIIGLAAQLEAAQPWTHLRPAVS